MTEENEMDLPRNRSRRHRHPGPAARLACVAAVLPGLCGAAPAPPPPAAAFSETLSFSFVALSPDGRTLAVDRVTGDGHKVVLFAVGSSEPLRVLGVGQGDTLRGLGWADARTVLVHVSGTVRLTGAPSARSTWEFWRTMAASLDGGPSHMLLMDDAVRRRVTGARVLAAGSRLPGRVIMESWDYSAAQQRSSIGTLLSDERRDSGWVSTLFDVDTATGKGRVLERGTPYTIQWLVDPDGTPRARAEWFAEKQEFTVMARDGRGWRPVHQQTGFDWMGLAGTTADGKALVVVGENGTDRSRAWSLPLDGGPPSVLFEDAAADVVGVLVDELTGKAVGFATGGLEPRQHWIDPRRAQQQRVLEKAFPGRDVVVAQRSDDGERVLVAVGSRVHPPVHYLVDFATGRADTLGEAYPGLAGAVLGESRSLNYPARDGASIPAYLTLPPGRPARDLPLVVLPHGGPEARDPAGFDGWAQFLATRGYAVLQPQFRGSTGFGRAHRLAGYGEWGGRMQDDLSDGVRHLVATGVADPARVCIVGASYGGYAALAGAAFTPELYACAVSVNGISDLPTMLGDLRRRGGDQSDEIGYWKEHIGPATDPRAAQRSPARAAAAVRAPVLLLHGANDTVVPPSQSQLMAKALAEAGMPHRYLSLPGEDHWLSQVATRKRVLEEIETFLDGHLRR
jgi:dipeptidyl aminopeptidase/acylaminoacyl peptidase